MQFAANLSLSNLIRMEYSPINSVPNNGHPSSQTSERTSEPIGARLRDGDHSCPRRKEANRANEWIERVARQQIMNVPDHGFAKA